MPLKTFDFEHPDFMRQSDYRKNYIKNNHDQPITEDEYVQEVNSWPKRERHNSKSRSPSRSRKSYRKLKQDFGFFGGGNEQQA